MTKRGKGTCKDCDRHVGEENLSKKNLCYVCARGRMLKYFDNFWKRFHPEGVT